MIKNRVRRTGLNAALLFGSRIIDVASSILQNVMIARYLGATGYGDYSFIISFTVSILSISYFGLERIAVRELSKNLDRSGEYLGAVVISRWIMSAVAITILVAIVPFIDLKSDLLPVLLILSCSELVGASASVFLSAFRAYERIEYEMYITVLWRIFLISIVGGMIYFDQGLIGISLALLISNLLRGVVTVTILKRKFTKPLFTMNYPLIRSIMKDAVFLGVAVMLSNWFTRVAQIVLNFLQESEHVGFFQIGQSIVLQLGMVAMSISISLLPLISRQAADPEKNAKEVNIIYSGMSVLLITLGLIIFIISQVFSKEVIVLLFGKAYLESLPSFRILLLSIIPLFISTFTSFFFIAYNIHKSLNLSWLLALTVSILSYFVMIPKMGILGAAWGYVVGMTVLALTQFIFIKRSVISFIKLPIASFIVYMLVALIFVAVVDQEMEIKYKLIVAAIAISALLFRLMLHLKESLEFIRNKREVIH